MTEQTPESSFMGEGDAGSPGDTGDQQPKSVEEVLAEARFRQSQSDKAHAAETAALKAQIDALTKAPVAPQEGESADAARARTLEAELAQARSENRMLALRQAYPRTASILGDAMVGLPDAALAASEAAYEAGTELPRRTDPNAARRPAGAATQGQQKPMNEKTKDELLSDLRRMAPAYQEAMKEGSF